MVLPLFLIFYFMKNIGVINLKFLYYKQHPLPTNSPLPENFHFFLIKIREHHENCIL